VGPKEVEAYVEAYAEATDSGYGPGETCVCYSKYTHFFLLYPQPEEINASGLKHSEPQKESRLYNLNFYSAMNANQQLYFGFKA
jgi:hypothetical protein